MKSLSIRQTREALPKLEKLLARHGRLEIRRRGKTIARIESAETAGTLPSLEKIRAAMPFQNVPSERLVRADRDER